MSVSMLHVAVALSSLPLTLLRDSTATVIDFTHTPVHAHIHSTLPGYDAYAQRHKEQEDKRMQAGLETKLL